MDEQPAARPAHESGPFPEPADTIEEETGEGLLLNDPLVMSMYQTSSPPKQHSPDSSPESSPARQQLAPDQLAEESLSDREFEQMEAVAAAAAAAPLADITQTRDFSDFGHPNLLDGDHKYVIDEQDPFSTPAKAGTKSSDEEEYEVIRQADADVSNLLSLSPERTAVAADTTIIGVDTSATADEAHESFPPAPSPPPSPPPPPLPAAAPPAGDAVAAAAAAGAAGGGGGGGEERSESASSHGGDDDDDIAHVLSAPSDPRIPSSDSEPDPVSAPAPVSVPHLPAAPKKTATDSDETITRPAKHLTPGPNTVAMASADSSTSGCPFTAGESLLLSSSLTLCPFRPQSVPSCNPSRL